MKEIEVIFEDKDLLVCRKDAGIPVQTANFRQTDLEHMLKNYRVKKGESPYIGVVHRLDQPVEGLLVFAKNKQTAAALSKEMQGFGFQKEYVAVVEGMLEEGEQECRHFLEKDGKTNTSYVVEQGKGKEAILRYQRLAQGENCSLVRVHLQTGRHHQIRVQMAAIGHPILGDSKYGHAEAKGSSLALCAQYLTFTHPANKEKMRFSVTPKGVHFQQFQEAILL